MMKTLRVFFLIIFLTIIATFIALPKQLSFRGYTLKRPNFHVNLLGKDLTNDLDLKQGLDIQGGMQVTLGADMTGIPTTDRQSALDSAKDVITRRVDLYGVNEPVIQTVQSGNDYRITVELAGVNDASQALQLIGTTAQLDFRLLQASPSAKTATPSAAMTLDQFKMTGLTGKYLRRSSVTFDQQTGEPEVAMEFNDEGTKMFADITRKNVGQFLAVFLDGFPIVMPQINNEIPNGTAVIKGSFTLERAKQLSIQLNAGALPVPITVLQQSTVGASLGQSSVNESLRAGLIGLALIIIFMISYYGFKGMLASISLIIYAILTVAVYKLFGVTLTLPGVAGLLLTIGMAVDANILIFERMKEEIRSGRIFNQALEIGFQRAWNSIKDANVTTILISLVLINPADFQFLNTSGLVRGFGLTLLIGILISLFTSMVVTKTLMKLFLSERVREPKQERKRRAK